MNDAPEITSLQNPLIKHFLSLKENKKSRLKSGQFVLEGLREFRLAQEGGFAILQVFICNDILEASWKLEFLGDLKPATRLITVSKKVYERMAYRGKTEGLVAIAEVSDHRLDTLKFKRENPLVLVAESPEKPGNIGALLRTADAAGLDAVIIADPKGDLYNPNVVRSSIGCLFTVPLGVGTNQEVLTFLKTNGITIYAASLQAATHYHTVNFREATALAVGAESQGLTRFWYEHADDSIVIPMEGSIDSMNVSVSAAILIFEAKRQRWETK